MPATLKLTDSIFALLDERDMDELHRVEFSNGFVWEGRIPSLTWRPAVKKHTTYVVATFGSWLELRLHRAVMNAKLTETVDHRDHNGLNNVRENLRIATAAQNGANRVKSPQHSSRFKGVSLHRQTGRWEASLRVNRNKIHIGLFEREEDAARAYNAKAAAVWGEFAHLNAVA